MLFIFVLHVVKLLTTVDPSCVYSSAILLPQQDRSSFTIIVVASGTRLDSGVARTPPQMCLRRNHRVWRRFAGIRPFMGSWGEAEAPSNAKTQRSSLLNQVSTSSNIFNGLAALSIFIPHPSFTPYLTTHLLYAA